MNFRLRDADRTLRLFITVFLMVLSTGYTAGLLFVEHKSGATPSGIQEQFLGSPDTEISEEVAYSKSANEMYVFLHNHILSLSLVFFAVGGIFYFSSIVRTRLKMFLMVEPLVAVATTFGGIALVRFVSPHFSWLVLGSGISLFVCYFVMVLLIIKELWFPKTPCKCDNNNISFDRFH
jgi:hypothetical protein